MKIAEKLHSGVLGWQQIAAIANLWVKLKDRWREFDIILSDDAGGRPLALLLTKLINQKRAAEGLNPLNVYFIAAGSILVDDIKSGHVREGLNVLLSNLQQRGISKPLIATDHVASGNTVQALDNILQDFEMMPVFAAVSVEVDALTSGNINPWSNQRIIYGDSGELKFAGRYIHNETKALGITSNVTLTRIRASFAPERLDRLSKVEFDSEAVRLLREDLNTLAKELVEVLGP